MFAFAPLFIQGAEGKSPMEVGIAGENPPCHPERRRRRRARSVLGGDRGGPALPAGMPVYTENQIAEGKRRGAMMITPDTRSVKPVLSFYPR